MSEVIDKVTDQKPVTAIALVQARTAEMEKVAAGIAELSTKYGNVAYAVSTTKGMDEAKAARVDVREHRYRVQNARDAAKNDLNAVKRDIECRAEQICAQLLAIESPIDAQIKAEEDRKAAEKAARERAERERVQAIEARIASLATFVTANVHAGAAKIAGAITELEATTIDGSFAELQSKANRVKDESLASLRSAHLKAVEAESRAAALAVQEAELAKQRAEQAKAEAVLRAKEAELAKREQEAKAKEHAAAEAERKRIEAAELKARQEAEAKARAEAEERERAIQQQREKEQAEHAARIAAIERLNAAAPKLLLAAKELLAHFRHCFTREEEPFLSALERAINEAEGTKQ